MDKSLYTRPNKPSRIVVTKRRDAPCLALPDLVEPVCVDAVTECHITPPDVADRMVDYLELKGNHRTLEPQAANGSLVHALLQAAQSPENLTAIERSISLCNVLSERFNNDCRVEPINECFLEYAARVKGEIEYQRIICNPPFSNIKTHINAALSLLGPLEQDDAILVALVPMTYKHPEMELLEELPNDTFSTAKVYTKLIRFTR